MEIIKLDVFRNKKSINDANLIIDIKTMLFKNEEIFKSVNKVIAQVRKTKFLSEGEEMVSIFQKDKYVEEALLFVQDNQKKLTAKINELIESVRG